MAGGHSGLQRLVPFTRDKIVLPVASALLSPWISRKWQHDVEATPLEPQHYDLYHEIHTYYAAKLREFPSIASPVGLNEKIQWLKLFDQREIQIDLCDKLKAKEFVSKRLGPGYTPDTFAVGERLADLPLTDMTRPFVLKTTHGCGGVEIFRGKETPSGFSSKVAHIRRSLGSIYGLHNGEWGYRYVQPRVFCEEYLDFSDQGQPPDFKFYCVEGEVRFCHYIFDRSSLPKEQVVDRNGTDIGIPIHPPFPYHRRFDKPSSWKELLEVAAALSVGFKCVRVDLYTDGGRVMVGEITFWPQAGTYRGSGQRRYDDFLDFDMSTTRPPVHVSS